MNSRTVAFVALMVCGSALVARQDGCSLPDFGQVLPIPTPAPTGELWLVVVEEKDNRNLGLAAVERSQWKANLSQRQVQFRVYDDDQPEASSYVAALGPNVAGALIVGPDGKKHADAVMPQNVTTQWFDDLLKEVGR